MTDQEINEAVAKKLGWKLETQKTKCESLEDPHLHGSRPGEYMSRWCLEDYCHSIAAAWEIMESQKYFSITHGAYGYRCNLGEIYPGVEAEADTAPMAICAAFLKLP